MFEPDDISCRLNNALDIIGFNKKEQGRQVHFADQLGISQSSARRWLEGISIPPFDMLAKVEEVFHISAQWLLFGEGAPFKQNDEIDFKKNVENHIIYIPCLKKLTDFLNYLSQSKRQKFHLIPYETSILIESDGVFALNIWENMNNFLKKQSLVYIDSYAKPKEGSLSLIYHQEKKEIIFCETIFENQQYHFQPMQERCFLPSNSMYIYCGVILEINYALEGLIHPCESFSNQKRSLTFRALALKHMLNLA